VSFETLVKKIKGNVVPVPAQFNPDLSLNLLAYREHIHFLLENEIKLFYLALSASEFMYMTPEERLKVTGVVADAVGGKGLLMAQPPSGGWIDEQIKEAKAMLAAGADAIVVKPVELREKGKFFFCSYGRGSYSSQRHDDYFIKYMEQFAEETGAPLVYHDKPFANGMGLSLEGLARIVEIENVVCIKVHVPDPCMRQAIYESFGDRVATFEGFGKTMEFWALHWGATARHSCWSWFDPVHDKNFFNSVKNGNYAEAVRLVNREWPLAQAIRHSGFLGYKEVMTLVGLPSGPVRIPGETLDRQQKEMLRRAVIQIGLLKE